MEKREIGKMGENIASKYLTKKGYLILARNHKEGFDEIDIIARHPNRILIFCEVKTLNNREGYPSLFMPEDNLSQLKLKKLIRGSQVFLARHPEWERGMSGWQIDLITVVLRYEEKLARVRHYENI
jgi:putative endonuclease